MTKKILLSILMIAALSGFAQKKKRVLIEAKDKVIAEAVNELNTAMQAPDGNIYEFAVENNISGKFTFDITIHEKGLVATVFVVDNDGVSIKSQNALKDFIKDFRFEFKMPKNVDYKFQYVFNFK